MLFSVRVHTILALSTGRDVGRILRIGSKLPRMRELFDSDGSFYTVVGAATIAIFVLAVIAIAAVGPAGLGGRELAGLVGGFAIFMLVFFVSYAIRRVEDHEAR